MKQTFGIFSPQYELAKNIPKILLLKTLMPDSQNILLKDGKIVRRLMREKNLVDGSSVKVQTPDTNPILEYHTFVERKTGSQYLLAFTKAHIYCWDWTEKWVVKFTCSADCENWEVKSYNDQIIATNNVDPVLVWDTTGYFMPLQNTTAKDITGASQADPCVITIVGHGYSTGDRIWIEDITDMVELNDQHYVITKKTDDTFELDDVDSQLYTEWDAGGGTCTRWDGIEYETGKFLTKAKYMTIYENFLILGYTYENGNYYPQRMRWNAIGNEDDFKDGNSGSTEVGKSDFLKGFGKYQGLLIVYKAKSYYKYWLTADTTLVFNGAFISMTIGCRCSKSIVNDNKGRLYWYASDGTFKEISKGTISQPIQTDIVDLIYQSSVEGMRSDYIDETEEVCWAIPFDNILNNKLLTFKESKWGQVDIALTAIGGYRQP